MRTLSGRRIKVVQPATKRSAFMLDGREITRTEATTIAMHHCASKPVLTAIHMRDCTPKESPIQTARGLYWHELVVIA